MFLLEEVYQPVEESQTLLVSGLRSEYNVAKFELTLNLTNTTQGLHCEVEYATDLFESETIERLLEHWQVLLTAVVAQPEQRICDLPLLTATERYQLRVVWN